MIPPIVWKYGASLLVLAGIYTGGCVHGQRGGAQKLADCLAAGVVTTEAPRDPEDEVL